MKSYDDLARDNEKLRVQLDESQELLQAIRTGSVDALVVEGLDGRQVYTLEGADHPYRLFVETMNEGAVTVSAAGAILYGNPSLADLVGMPLTQILGADFRRFVTPADRPQLDWLLDDCDGDHGRADVTLEDADGNLIPVQLSARRISLKSEDLLCLVVTDLRGQKLQASLREREEDLRTFSRQLEELVEKRTAELVHSQDQLRAMATELNLTEQRERKRMAVELHDHLQQMLVLAKLKLAQGKRWAAPLPACADVMKQVEEVLTEALTYTRTLVTELSPPVLREFGLPAGLKWLGDWMQRHDVAVTVECADCEDLELPEDQAVLLFQSVRELLINSAKYAKTGQATVRLARDHGHLRIEVQDRGAGFDLAAKTAASTVSTAALSKFGLFSIRERMRVLGGRLEIESSSGQGTTARLLLPLAGKITSDGRGVTHEEGPTEADGHPPSVVRSPPRLTLVTDETSRPHPRRVPRQLSRSFIRVLLVDDHTMVRQGLRSVLESYTDVEVVGEATNGYEAVALVERHRPAIVVMDINMPEMSGIEATTVIKARHPQTIIIGLSVNADGENQTAMLQAGAATLLTKEAAVEELYQAIQQVLGTPQNVSRDP